MHREAPVSQLQCTTGRAPAALCAMGLTPQAPAAGRRDGDTPAKGLAECGVTLWFGAEPGTGAEGGREGEREEQTYFLIGIQGLAGLRGQALGHLTASQESIETKVFFDVPCSKKREIVNLC